MGADTDAPPSGEMSSEGVSFFKKSLKGKNMRRRPVEDEAEPSKDGVALQKSKIQRVGEGSMSFSTGTGVTKKGEVVVEEKRPAFAYESSRQVQTQNDSRATAVLETETEYDKDARAIRERVLKQAEEALNGNKSEDNIYRGVHGYKDHTAGFRREHTVASEKSSGAHGPLRASQHIRYSVRFDYQPDICKDYKETGYCGYGDACKFMHDRGDYKSGWQLEKDWDEKEKRKKQLLARGIVEGEGVEEEDSDDDKELPFACFICRKPFVEPVVTRCKHYFCEHCALKHNARNKNCYVCNKPTNGVFNTAHEIAKRLKEAGTADVSKAESDEGSDQH
eukprot:jgi/Mesen1/2668/ME000167S01819